MQAALPIRWKTYYNTLKYGADYVFRPYRFTTTKQKLSPILGLAGISGAVQQLAAQGIQLPVLPLAAYCWKIYRNLIDQRDKNIQVTRWVAMIAGLIEPSCARWPHRCCRCADHRNAELAPQAGQMEQRHRTR